MGTKIPILSHYRKLLFFLLHRFEENNYSKMRYYLSEVLLSEIEPFIDLKGKKVLDVGGSSGEFCSYLSKETGCVPINLDPYPPKKLAWKRTVKAFAHDMPFESNSFDLVICRGVLEHIPQKHRADSVKETYRVLKKGGLAYFVIPPWYNFHAGHGMKPFHVFPFKVAKFTRNLLFKKKIKENSYAEIPLFKLTFRGSKRLFEESGFAILETLDTHLRLHFLTKIPLLREFTVPAVAFIMKK